MSASSASADAAPTLPVSSIRSAKRTIRAESPPFATSTRSAKRPRPPKYGVKGYLDYREMLAKEDVDAVIVATPDHWHATIALAAMDRGKDVYLEKPMCHTIDEAKKLVDTVKETKRVLQVGSQTTSGDQWHKAKKAIADGMLGQVLMSQGSYHRNSKEGEWNWPIDAGAGPDGKGENYIDWKMWLGPAQKRNWDRRPILPLPQVLGLLRRYRDRLVLPRRRADEHLLGRAAVPVQGHGRRRHLRLQEAARESELPDREVPDTFSLIGTYPKAINWCSAPRWRTPSTFPA